MLKVGMLLLWFVQCADLCELQHGRLVHTSVDRTIMSVNKAGLVVC